MDLFGGLSPTITRTNLIKAIEDVANCLKEEVNDLGSSKQKNGISSTQSQRKLSTRIILISSQLQIDENRFVDSLVLLTQTFL
jgi:hypothetical protein